MQVWVCDSLQKVFWNTKKPPRAPRKLDLSCALNEREDGQVVVLSETPIESLRVELSELKRQGGGRLPAEVLSAQFVWCVPVMENTRDNGNGKHIIRKAPDFFPDALTPRAEVSVAAKRAQAIWITVSIPEETKKGRYRSTIKVIADDRQVEVPLAVTVHPFALPKRPSLYMTNWLSLESLEHFCGVGRFSEAWWSLIDQVAANMAAHRQNVILTPLQELATLHKTELGYRCDFTQLDRWIETFDRHGAAELIEGSHLAGRAGGWESEFAFRELTVCDGNGQRHVLPRTSVTDEERQYFLRVLLSQVYEHLDEVGSAARLVVHLADEPVKANADSYRGLSEFVKSVLPTVRRIDAVMHEGLDGAVDIRVPQIQHLEDDVESRPANEELWFYTCLAPQGPYPNRFIDFSSLKTRILHWMNWRYQATGYLHWGYNYWRQWQGSTYCNPFYTATGESERLAGGTTRLPPGDPCVVYPGEDGLCNSIRWEMVRKGMEDYEYLKILEERIADSKPNRPAAKAGQKLLDSIRDKTVQSHSQYVTDDQAFLKTREALTKAVLAFEKRR